MQQTYQTTTGAREYHRVVDFDVSYSAHAIDSLMGLFLTLQHASARFVSASLLLHQRDCVAILSSCPIVVGERGRFYMPLQFATIPLPLAVCNFEAWTVRVVVAEDPGANFYLVAEGAAYPIAYTLESRGSRFQAQVHWAGAPWASTLDIVGGRAVTPAICAWEPRTHGPAFLSRQPPPTQQHQRRVLPAAVEEYEP